MVMWLRQSTSITIHMGPFLDATDGVTPEEGLASALDATTTGIQLSKNGATMADRNSATVPTHDNAGLYKVHINTSDSGTLGRLRVSYEDPTTCCPVWENYMVVTQQVWDSFFAADLLDVSVTQLS